MIFYLILISVVIFACVLLNKITGRIGIPALLAFIGLGMLLGSNGPFHLEFSNYAVTEKVCTVALIFIMFYGGFGTNWKQAKKVATQSVLLSTVGVAMTASICAVFCHFVLTFPWIESFLMGSVISSTDAASVFSILRSRKMNLKFGTASLLELESGSNDPVAYMMTAIFIAVYQGSISGGQIAYMIFAQIVYGVAIGAGISVLSLFIFKKIRDMGDGFNMIFVVGIALLAYAVPATVGGNGYLSTYIVGIVLGNAKIKDKPELVHFFDGLTIAAQMLVFFLLGFLSEPVTFPSVVLPGIIIAAFVIFAARPAVVFALLAPFKTKLSQKLLISWSGLRGASSIVFAISVFLETSAKNNIFYISFFIVLVSIFLQGSLLPFVARKLDMIDEKEDIMKTFTDYSEEVPIQFVQCLVPTDHPWVDKRMKDIILPPDSIAVLLCRGTGRIIPNGDTVIQKNDRIILSAPTPCQIEGVELTEIVVDPDDGDYVGKSLSEIDKSTYGLVIMIIRGEEIIIPKGDVRLAGGDVLVINNKIRQS